MSRSVGVFFSNWPQKACFCYFFVNFVFFADQTGQYCSGTSFCGKCESSSFAWNRASRVLKTRNITCFSDRYHCKIDFFKSWLFFRKSISSSILHHKSDLFSNFLVFFTKRSPVHSETQFLLLENRYLPLAFTAFRSRTISVLSWLLFSANSQSFASAP